MSKCDSDAVLQHYHNTHQDGWDPLLMDGWVDCSVDIGVHQGLAPTRKPRALGMRSDVVGDFKNEGC